MTAPLAKLVVVDVATLGAAPQIATFFGDLGARVIKVEHPRGDPLRLFVDADGVALQWKLINRNKECVTLDVAAPEGRAVLDRLLERADVLVSALPAQRLADVGLDAAALRAHHPRLVAVNLTTYGTSGPWRDRPGSGTLAEAVTGFAHLTGPPDAPPTLAPVGLGDWLGVLQGIIAALTGLLTRDAGGGTWDVAMTDPFLGLLGSRLAQVARSGVDPGRHGNRFPTMAPRNTYRARDGRWIAITAGTTGKVTFYKGRGCQTCNFTGMKGRVAIYEVMPITEELKDLVLKDASTAELRECAQAQGMRTLRQAGLQKVLEGTTTAAEVLRVTMS